MIELDGSYGEGGGQILRSALALSAVTGQAFRIVNIRAGRRRPGLLRQHLTCVRAAAAITQAQVDGDAIGSGQLTFRPGAVRAGDYDFAVGSAGSTTLVMQTVLLPLLLAPGPTTLRIEGGTHNPSAPPFDYVERVFFGALRRAGLDVELKLQRAGFYPAGGGSFRCSWSGPTRLAAIDLTKDEEVTLTARILVANLGRSIAHREAEVLAEALGLDLATIAVEWVQAHGPGNVVFVEAHGAFGVHEMTCGFGEKGVRAEDVALAAIEAMKTYRSAGARVGEHLADQLVLPMALGEGGVFRATLASQHLRTQCWVVNHFLGPVVTLHDEPGGTVRVEVSRALP